MAAPRSWANLPLDTISEVTRRVLCSRDRFEVALACRTWRAALARTPPPPPPLPWLFLPSGNSAHLYCMLRCRRSDQGFNNGGRFFGSHDSAFLFVARHHPDLLHQIVNYRYGETYPVPSMVCPRHHPDVEYVYHPMLILAATLSPCSRGLDLDDEECESEGVGIITYQPHADGPRVRWFAFWNWKMGGEVAFDVWPPDDPNSAMEDILYRQGGFHFLTAGEDILECRPDLRESDGDNDDDGLVAMPKWLRRFVPRDRSCNDAHVRARYLVESGEDLLMVVRLAPQPHMLTLAFKVFREVEPQVLDNGGGVPGYTWSWIELDALALAGKMLFVGRGCSRSYETADYPGLEDGVYFTDDRCFDDDEMMLCGFNERRYPCNDNRRWSIGPPPIVERFFRNQDPSHYSSPTWFLP